MAGTPPLSHAEALAQILGHAQPLPVRKVPLDEALGLAAAEAVLAGEPVPPFTNSAMDGFAVRAAEAGAGAALPVAGDIPAGRRDRPSLPPGAAFRIMTGAPLPEGADAIVPVEETEALPGAVRFLRPALAGAHIRKAGEDIPAGAEVLAAGTALGSAELAVLAAIGQAEVAVRPRPRVAILTSGDELVPASATPGPGQIRDANIHALAAQVREAGGVPLTLPRVADNREAVTAALVAARTGADLILTNGGISVGDYDCIKPALEGLGARPVFWKVAQKPGAPLGLWAWDACPVIGIPGNPVAAMLMAELYVRPALRRMMGFAALHRPLAEGILAESWRRSGRPDRTEFLRVRVAEDGQVRLAGPQGSGVLSSLMRADALLVVPPGPVDLAAGTLVRLHLLHRAEGR